MAGLLFLPPLLSNSFQCNKGLPKSICLPENYSKFELPISDEPNIIGISIDIGEVLGINGKDYSITFSTYFNVEWTERRLNLKEGESSQVYRDGGSSGLNLTVFRVRFLRRIYGPHESGVH